MVIGGLERERRHGGYTGNSVLKWTVKGKCGICLSLQEGGQQTGLSKKESLKVVLRTACIRYFMAE